MVSKPMGTTFFALAFYGICVGGLFILVQFSTYKPEVYDKTNNLKNLGAYALRAIQPFLYAGITSQVTGVNFLYELAIMLAFSYGGRLAGYTYAFVSTPFFTPNTWSGILTYQLKQSLPSLLLFLVPALIPFGIIMLTMWQHQEYTVIGSVFYLLSFFRSALNHGMKMEKNLL